MSRSAIVLIPVFNNAPDIGRIVNSCRSLGFRVVVVNDGSTDGSGDNAFNAGAVVLNFRNNRGKGAALRSGFDYIKKEYQDADLTITIDADGQHNPEDIPGLLKSAEDGGTLVIGSRAENQAEMPILRLIANRFVSGFISLLLGREIRDTQSGFRVFPARILAEHKFIQTRYGIETEMLFAAKASGLSFCEVPIRVVYKSGAQIFWKKDLTNFLDIISIAVRAGLLRSAFLGSLVLPVLALGLAGLLVWQFNYGLAPLFKKAAGKPDFWSKLSPGIGTKERLAAFRWLEENTPENAIILAPRQEGHRIMAFANRRVIVSSKVYPSEARNVAERERDIAKFFFALSLEEGRRILEKYEVSYILLSRPETPTWMCRLANACQWVNVSKNPSAERFYAGDLTPEGKQNTIIGKLFAEAETQLSRKVWDSPQYLIYRVTYASPPAECEFSHGELEKIADFARLFLAGRKDVEPAGALSRKCSAAVALWSGGKLSGYAASDGESLAENIVFALRGFGKESGIDQRLEFWLWNESAKYPITPDYLWRAGPAPDLGYSLERNRATSHFLPFMAARLSSKSGEAVLSFLCKELNLGPRCFAERGAKLSAFPVSGFIASAKTGTPVHGMYGTIPINPDALSWDEKSVKNAVRSALDWIYSLQRPDKTFRTFADPMNVQKELEPRDIALDALGSWVLAEGYAGLKDPKYLFSASAGLSRLKREISNARPHRTNALSFALMAHSRLWEVIGMESHLAAAREYASYLRSLKFTDNSFPERFEIRGGSAFAADNEKTKIAAHVAFWALSRYSAASGAKAVPQDIRELSNDLMHQFVLARIMESGDLNLAETSRLANGFYELYRVSKNPEDLRNAEIVGRWLLAYQWNDHPYGLRGAFPKSPDSSYADSNGVGRVAEGLVASMRSADKLGKEFKIYEDGLKAALLWLVNMQYDAQSLYSAPIENRAALKGGIRDDMTNPVSLIGSAAHFALAGLWYFYSP